MNLLYLGCEKKMYNVDITNLNNSLTSWKTKN